MGFLGDFVTRNPVKRFLVDHMSRYRRDITSSYRQQKALEYATADRLEALQQDQLRKLLTAAQGSPYYKRILDGFGKSPDSFRLDDLRDFPFLTRDVLQTEQAALCVPGQAGAFENYSGGSTGVPIRFLQDYRYRVRMSVATRCCNELAGAFTGARMAKLWGAPQDRRQIEGWGGRAKLWALNMRYYDTFDMGPARMRLYHQQMEQFQPDLIQAYASSIFLLAQYLREEGIRPTYPGVSIITTAEKLSPRMRKEIEEVFAAPVFDRYGSREASALAAECGCHDGLHVQMPGYIVETIHPQTGRVVEEEPGEIAITILSNYAMPFVRYRIGDMGTLTRKRCACGRTLYRLREILGRTSDNFLMPDGRIVHGEYFTHLFYGRDGIRQFQFVQHTRQEFTLRIVPSASYSAALAGLLESEIRAMIGAGPRLTIEVHQQIPKTASGKYRFTVSHLSTEEMLVGKLA